MSAKMRFGSYTGTGASLNIEVGFIPDFLIVVNETDGDIMHFWFDGMAAGASTDIGAAVIANPTGSISRFVGTPATVGQGFATGADASESAKVYRWAAFQSA